MKSSAFLLLTAVLAGCGGASKPTTTALLPIVVERPSADEHVPPTFHVSGTASVFEATLVVQTLRDGKTIERKTVTASPVVADDSLDRAIAHLCSLQHPSGYWEAEMVWNTMLLSQWVIVQKIVGRPIHEDRRRRILRHYEVTQLPDGTVPWYVPEIPGGRQWTPARPGAGWGDVVTLTPWALYQASGDAAGGAVQTAA